MRLPIARDQPRALAVNQFETLANIGEPNTAPARRRLITRESGAVIFNDDTEHLAVTAR